MQTKDQITDQLKYTKAIISHQWNTILTAGCIFITGLWVLFMITLFILLRIA